MMNSRKSDEQGMNAPYNFIGLNHRIMEAYEDVEQIPQNNGISRNTLSGEIYYRMEVESPLIIGDMEAEPADAGKTDYIPASSVRGLVRSNLQILSYSSVSEDIEDRRLRYRSIWQGEIGEAYAAAVGKRTIAGCPYRVKYEYIFGGIIGQEQNGDYYIRQCMFPAAKKGYISIDLREIQRIKGWQRSFFVDLGNGRNVFDCLGNDSYSSRYRRHWSGKQITKPFYTRVTFDMDHGKLCAVSGSGGTYNGYLLSSGYIPDNYVFYLVPDTGGIMTSFRLPDRLIEDYKRENPVSTDAAGDYYELPVYGEKPVFFLRKEGGEDIQFGFTPLFPVFYKNRIHDGIPKEQFSDVIDYDRALFGFKNKKGNYAGRLSFSNAVMKVGKTESVEVPLLYPPKPQYTPAYVEDALDYNRDEFILNGIKQYWLHEQPARSFPRSLQIKLKENSAVSAGSVMEGCIRFFNLREDELGLLLWSLVLNPDSKQNIGSGKPWGYGRIKVSVSQLHLWDDHQMYFSGGDLFSGVFQAAEPGYFIEKYQQKLEEFLKQSGESAERLENFFMMKNQRSINRERRISYANMMEFRKRTPLVSVRQFVGNADWIIIPKTYIMQEAGLRWEAFIKNPPHEIKHMHPAHELLAYYWKFNGKLELFEKEKYFFIKKEILDDLLELFEDFRKKQYNLQMQEEQYRRFGRTVIREHALRCMEEIEQYGKQFEEVKKQFLEKNIPQPSLRAEVLFSDSKQNHVSEKDEAAQDTVPELETRIRVSVSKRHQPALLEKIQVFKDGQKLWENTEEAYVYNKKGKVYTVCLPYENQELQDGECVRQIMLEYSYRTGEKREMVSLWQTVKMSLEAEEYRELLNPYSAYARGAEVSDKNMFFGREETIRQIIARINGFEGGKISGQNIVLFGQKRAGKSTILYHIKERLREEYPSEFVVVNVGNLGGSEKSEAGIQYFILGCLRRELRRFYPEIYDKIISDELNINETREKLIQSDNPTAVFVEVFNNFMEVLNEKKWRLVLLIDEFTYIYGEILDGEISRDFMIFWKAFIQNYGICAVLVGQDFMPDFINDYRNEFGASNPVRISYLEMEDASKLITEPFRRKNGRDGFTRDAVDLILQLSAGSAYYIMFLCDRLVSYMNRKKQGTVISAEIVRQFVKDVLLNENSNERLDTEFFDPLLSDGLYDRWYQENADLLHQIALCSYENGWCKISELRQRAEPFIQDWRFKMERLVSRDVLLIRENREVKIKVQLLSEWLIFKFGGED